MKIRLFQMQLVPTVMTKMNPLNTNAYLNVLPSNVMSRCASLDRSAIKKLVQMGRFVSFAGKWVGRTMVGRDLVARNLKLSKIDAMMHLKLLKIDATTHLNFFAMRAPSASYSVDVEASLCRGRGQFVSSGTQKNSSARETATPIRSP